MTRKVVIVTDSTSYLPQQIIDRYGIRVAPLVLIWGEDTYRDGVDILPNEFYQRLQNAKIMPSTSQVLIEDFRVLFNQLINEGYDILTIVISKGLSGTLNSALQAAKGLPEERIRIMDSETTSMAMGFQLITAARAAEAGMDLDACLKAAEEARDKTGVIFVVDTLEFLHRGGRIGGAARFIGTALRLKPILEVVDGKIDAVESVRTKKKALERLVELVEERVDGRYPVHIAGIHANANQEMAAVVKAAVSRMEVIETLSGDVSPVIGTHTGPGTVGLAYMVS